MTERERVQAAYLKELAWIKDEKQRQAWLKEWMRIYEIGMIAAAITGAPDKREQGC